MFSSWIHEIYRVSHLRTPFELSLIFHTAPSEWHLFSLGTDSSSPEQDGEEVATDTDAQPDSAIAGLTGVTPSAVGAAPFQPAAAFSETNTAGNCPPPLDPPPTGNPHPAPPTDVPTRAAANQDQRILDLEALPTNATEATWMKSKKTLKYFRDAHKMGKLSDLHIHWYQLEEALGFQETVSCPFPKLRGNLLISDRLQRVFRRRVDRKSFRCFSNAATTTRRTTDSKQYPLVPRSCVGGKRSRVHAAQSTFALAGRLGYTASLS